VAEAKTILAQMAIQNGQLQLDLTIARVDMLEAKQEIERLTILSSEYHAKLVEAGLLPAEVDENPEQVVIPLEGVGVPNRN